MLTTSISDFQDNTEKYLDDVTSDFETLVIDRGNNKAVVILSLDEYNSINTTLHELSSKKNKQKLDKAITKLESGKYIHKELIEA